MRRLLLWTSVIGSFALIAPFQIEAQAPLPGPKAVPPANPVRPQAPRQGSPAAKPPTNALETTKRSKVPDTGGSTGFYGSIELLHVGNRYEASRDTLVRQDATGQSRLILGYKLPESNLDIYATLGAVKQPRSQQLVARRPEVEADLHFLRTSDYNLLGYAIHKIPWSEDPMDPELTLPQKHGSETLLGGRLTFGNQKVPSAPSIFFFGGADAWTKMFSRRQYVAKEDKETQQFGLVQNSNGELVDDDMQHLHSEYHLGMGYVPTFWHELGVDLAAFMRRDFEPEYSELSGRPDDRYLAKNVSYYRVRLSYRFSKSVELTNEFFHFHRGFFAQTTTPSDRRYRNFARLSYKF